MQDVEAEEVVDKRQKRARAVAHAMGQVATMSAQQRDARAWMQQRQTAGENPIASIVDPQAIGHMSVHS